MAGMERLELGLLLDSRWKSWVRLDAGKSEFQQSVCVWIIERCSQRSKHDFYFTLCHAIGSQLHVNDVLCLMWYLRTSHILALYFHKLNGYSVVLYVATLRETFQSFFQASWVSSHWVKWERLNFHVDVSADRLNLQLHKLDLTCSALLNEFCTRHSGQYYLWCCTISTLWTE